MREEMRRALLFCADPDRRAEETGRGYGIHDAQEALDDTVGLLAHTDEVSDQLMSGAETPVLREFLAAMERLWAATPNFHDAASVYALPEWPEVEKAARKAADTLHLWDEDSAASG